MAYPRPLFRDYIQYREREMKGERRRVHIRERNGLAHVLIKFTLTRNVYTSVLGWISPIGCIFHYRSGVPALRASATARAISDLRWRSVGYHEGLDDGKGLSFIVANTPKGVDAIQGIKGQMTIKQRTVALRDLKRCEHSKKQYKRRRRERLFSFIQEHGIEKTERVFYPRARRVVHAELAARSAYGRARHIAVKIARKVLKGVSAI